MENINEIIERMIESQTRVLKLLEELKKEDFSIYLEGSYSEQIKGIEEVIEKLRNFNSRYNTESSNLNSILSYELDSALQTKLSEIRIKKLEEETDTPREAYENIEKYIAEFGTNTLLSSAMKWIKTQMPPQEVETKVIKFEVAKIKDSNVKRGDVVVEVEGEDGEEKIVYEVIGGKKQEIKREIVKHPVTKVVRVPMSEE